MPKYRSLLRIVITILLGSVVIAVRTPQTILTEGQNFKLQ